MNSANTMSLKKKMIIALCAIVGVIAIVVTSVFTTIAYLSASSSVSNVFTVGGVEILMDETAVDSDGKAIPNEPRRDMNSYHLVPGATYLKDPIIHVQPNSEESYLFITVKNDISAIAARPGEVHENGNQKLTIAEQLKNNGWAKLAEVTAGTVYVYVGNKMPDSGTLPLTATMQDITLSANKDTITDYPLFKEFSVSSAVTTADIKQYGAAKITINAFAIQDVGLDTVVKAWNAVVDSYKSYLTIEYIQVPGVTDPDVQG